MQKESVIQRNGPVQCPLGSFRDKQAPPERIERMYTKEFDRVLEELLEEYCLFLVKVEFVDDVYEWCKNKDVEEWDRDKPLKLVVNEEKGCKLVVNELIPEKAMHDRLKALEVRSALTNVATNKADLLNSDKKKLAWLFLMEYASTLPDLEDEILADDWSFKEMERLGYFKE